MAKTSITAKLGLDTTAFQKGLARSQKSIIGFVKSGIAQFGALAGAAGLGAMASSALRLAADITNLSRVANTGSEDFQKFAFAAKTVGVEQDKLADILKDVSDKVGDFLQTGGGPLKDFFENIAPKVGVTAEQFRNLSGKDALQLYVSSLEKANISQNEMTFFMEAIASDATLLLPLLQDNAQALTNLGNEAKKLGLVMGDDLIKKLNKSSIELNKFKTSATILTGIFLSKAIPAFTMFSQGLLIIGDAAGTGISKLSSFFGFLSRSIDSILTPANKAFMSLSKAIEGMGHAAKLNKKEAAKAFEESKKLSRESANSIKNIPAEIAENAKRLNLEMEIDDRNFQNSKIERAKKTKDALNDLLGETVKDAASAKNKISQIGNGGIGGASGATAKTANDGPMGLDIKRGEYEARNDFLKRRDRARVAHLKLNEKMRVQAMTGESSGISQALISAAMGQTKETNSDQHTIAKLSQSMDSSLKVIQREISGN